MMKKMKIENAGPSKPSWFLGLLTAEAIVKEYGYQKGVDIINDMTLGKHPRLFVCGLFDYVETEAFKIAKADQIEIIQRIQFDLGNSHGNTSI